MWPSYFFILFFVCFLIKSHVSRLHLISRGELLGWHAGNHAHIRHHAWSGCKHQLVST